MAVLHLMDPVNTLSGVGPQRAKLFASLGLHTLEDLLRYYPRGYEDRTRICSIDEAPIGETCSLRAFIVGDPHIVRLRGKLSMVKCTIADESGRADVTFFNQTFLKNQLKAGQQYLFYGRIGGNLVRKSLTNPAFEKAADDTAPRLVPVYRATAALSSSAIAKAIRQVLPLADRLPDPLPEELRRREHLMPLAEAVRTLHAPTDPESLALAKNRLIFEELLTLQLGLFFLKDRRSQSTGAPVVAPPSLAPFFEALGFPPTGAQRRVIGEILADMASTQPMNRLVQGDVGSGKTAVAAAAIYAVWKNGGQAALMAPTEILAEQHLDTMQHLLAPLGIRMVLLTSGQTAAKKREALELLQSGKADLAIGTHALLEESVRFSALQLVVTDEQHRFGVAQRSKLSAKGCDPHLMVMSATPIPRTLALMIYGDLDLSIIDELPPGRQAVKTYAFDDSMRERVYRFIRKEADEGRQAYVVCPLVEEDETGNGLKDVTTFATQLADTYFDGQGVGLLHGRLRPREKERIMRAFAAGEIKVLVATTVIEVGVNVPNATVMVVENAERFGLSQLHQLRGRVGRGVQKSYCVLFSEGKGDATRERLNIMTQTNDGFIVAQKDLELRGPGDFFGTRQHGLPTLRVASLSGDMRVLNHAQEEAKSILAADPALLQYPALKENVRRLFSGEDEVIFN